MKRRSSVPTVESHPQSERPERSRRKTNHTASGSGTTANEAKHPDEKTGPDASKEETEVILTTPTVAKKGVETTSERSEHRNKDLRSVLQEFTNSCASSSHVKYLHHLRAWCEGRCVNDDLCSSKGHPRSQIVSKVCESLPFILAHHLHDMVKLTKDSEWQDLLAALRSFHMFCVIRLYVPENRKLMAGLYQLESFNICEITAKLNHLVAYKYWNKIEADSVRRAAAITITDEDAEKTPEQLDENYYEQYLKFSFFPIEVEEVRPNGWVFSTSEECFFYRKGDAKTVFLQLPQSVASMGLTGMRLSHINLGYRNGFWRPIEDDTSCCIFFAKVNPPRIL